MPACRLQTRASDSDTYGCLDAKASHGLGFDAFVGDPEDMRVPASTDFADDLSYDPGSPYPQISRDDCLEDDSRCLVGKLVDYFFSSSALLPIISLNSARSSDSIANAVAMFD